MTRALLVAVGFGLAAVAVAQDKPAKLDPAKLAGKWEIVAGTKDGEKIDADKLKGTLTVTKEKLVMKMDAGEFEFAYKVDLDAKPASIDLEITEGPIGKGSKAKGIIGMDGEKVMLAYHPMEGERPKAFESKKDSGVFLFVMKKAATDK